MAVTVCSRISAVTALKIYLAQPHRRAGKGWGERETERECEK